MYWPGDPNAPSFPPQQVAKMFVVFNAEPDVVISRGGIPVGLEGIRRGKFLCFRLPLPEICLRSEFRCNELLAGPIIRSFQTLFQTLKRSTWTIPCLSRSLRFFATWKTKKSFVDLVWAAWWNLKDVVKVPYDRVPRFFLSRVARPLSLTLTLE